MAQQVSTTVVIQAKNQTQQGISEAKSSFQEFTSSLDSLTGGLGSKVTSLLANPWTAVAAGVAAAGKALVDLTVTGIDAQKGFEQLEASFGKYASTVDAFIGDIDRTTLASKDDLESMAKSLATYGMSMEDLQSTLQTTADIATTTGRNFSTVESAVISALNGQDRALTKIIPEWTEVKETYGSAEEALKHLGKQYEDTRVKFTSGSISQVLDNMSTNWSNIKDNLGQTLVMKINASGVLDRMEGFLRLIEDHTDRMVGRELAKETLRDLGLSIADAIQVKSEVPSEWIEYVSLSGTQYANTPDRIAAVRSYIDAHGRNALMQNYLDYADVNSQSYNITLAENYWQDIEPILNQNAGTMNWSHKKTTEQLQADVFASWDNYFSQVDWSSLSERSLDALKAMSTDPMLAAYLETKRPLVQAPVVGAGSSSSEDDVIPTGTDAVTFKRDHSVIGRSFRDFGMAYDVYQTGSGVSSMESVFGVKGPVSLGSEGLSFGLTDYEDIKDDLDQQHQEDQAQAQREAEEHARQIQSVISAINSVTSSISSLYNVWSNGYQAGDVGSTIGSIGSVVSLFSPLWGAGISAAGGIVGFLEQVFQGGQGEIESSLMEGTSGETAVYNGATTVHINNYFEGAYIVGAGGMTELANIMVEEIEGLQYTNR